MISRTNFAQEENTASDNTIAPVWDSPPAAGRQLVAVVGAIVQTTINTPTGWALAQTSDSGANTRTWLFTRTSDGGANDSPTWTIGSSTKCFGYIGAYSGVASIATDKAQVQTNTTVTTAAMDTPDGGMRVDAATGRHAFAGSAATISSPGGTVVDTYGSNAGSGSDITAGYVQRTTAAATGATTSLVSTLTEGQYASVSAVMTATPDPASGGGHWGLPL
jgi:hypothetical protein